MNSIFVAIASYRDYELVYTIMNCIENADHPGNLKFGICLQYDNDRKGFPEAGENCLEEYLPEDCNYEVIKFNWEDGHGGCWARQKAQEFYSNEKYTLQVDSHSRFAPGWDTDLIRMVETYPKQFVNGVRTKPLITMFPTGYYRDDENREDLKDYLDEDRSLIGTTIIKSWSPHGWFDFYQTEDLHPNNHPRRTRLLFGGFVFTYGEWCLDVMQDPDHYYTGEQEALSIRSFTHGYDMFNPDKKVIWHRVHPDGIQSKHFRDFEHKEKYAIACSRLRILLDDEPCDELGQYGLGSVRSLDSFYAYAGLMWYNGGWISEETRAGEPPTI